MELQLTFLILVPLGLAAAAVYRYGIRPAWRRAVDRCEGMDEREARERAEREAAEREIRGDAHP